MNKKLTLEMGNCRHRRYIPELIRLVRTRMLEPSLVLTQKTPLTSALDAYEAFDRREQGWTNVELAPAA